MFPGLWSHPGVLFKALILLVKDYTQLYICQINPNPTLINPTQPIRLKLWKALQYCRAFGQKLDGGRAWEKHNNINTIFPTMQLNFATWNLANIFRFTGGIDFVNLSQTLSFSASNQMHCVDVSILEDGVDEVDESFLLTVELDYAFSVRLDSYNITIVDSGELSMSLLSYYKSLLHSVVDSFSAIPCCLSYYVSITIVQSYTGKYHEFVAVCIVTSAQHK